jgi:hypothetical protein
MHDLGVSPVPIEPPSPITTSLPASPAASSKRTSSGKPQEQEENNWDFDEQEKSLGLHTLENFAE